jgi:hypothetical protein
LSQAPRIGRTGRQIGDITMTHFRLLGAAAIVAAAIAAPAFAQQAVSEPGMQAFYQSLGVGSRSQPAMSAMASAPPSHARARVKHVAPEADANPYR